jgi:hypothetical protein
MDRRIWLTTRDIRRFAVSAVGNYRSRASPNCRRRFAAGKRTRTKPRRTEAVGTVHMVRRRLTGVFCCRRNVRSAAFRECVQPAGFPNGELSRVTGPWSLSLTRGRPAADIIGMEPGQLENHGAKAALRQPPQNAAMSAGVAGFAVTRLWYCTRARRCFATR